MSTESGTTAKRKVVFCVPTVTRPYDCFIKSLEDSIPLIVDAGWDEGFVHETGNPYISAARAIMTRKALDAKADVIVYLDHDLSWTPDALLKLIETEGDVVAGTYRFKKDEEQYMGSLFNDDGYPIIRESDGALKALTAPAGFLKVTKQALVKMARKHPELLYGDPFNYSLDLFHHGAKDGMWWGEDYAFCVRWVDMGEDLWTPPDLNVHHHTPDRCFEGNLHEFLCRQEGGSNFKGEQT